MTKVTVPNLTSTKPGSPIETIPNQTNRTEVTMDDLPELPFEKVLSYLSLEEVIKLRAVSRSCLWKIDNYKVKHLCYSRLPFGHIVEKHRWVSGAFAQNFIVSIRFESFFKTFGQTILSHLKHLRLYEPDFHTGSRTGFTRALNSFIQLEELNLIGKWILHIDPKQGGRQLKLNLPILKSVQFEQVDGIEKLTLNAPMLKKVKLNKSRLFLDLVHGESVESLLIDHMGYVKLESLKNLKTIYLGHLVEIHFTLLFGLNQLKAIHLAGDSGVRELFDLKQRHGRLDLQIFRLGCLLSGPDDPTIHPDFKCYNEAILLYLAANPSKIADEIPSLPYLNYISKHLTPQIQATFVERLTCMKGVILNRPVQDIDRFLEFLKTYHIAGLVLRNQPQALLDRLPELCSLQKLELLGPPSNFEFLFRLKHLIELRLIYEQSSVDTRMIGRTLELEFLGWFEINYPDKMFEIFIETPKLFKVYLIGEKRAITQDLNVVIQFIQRNTRELGDVEMED